MSDRTQQQGRSYYTEHDFAFTPSAAAEGDIYRENNEWERGLLNATRVGDPSMDPEAKAAILNPAAPPAQTDPETGGETGGGE